MSLRDRAPQGSCGSSRVVGLLAESARRSMIEAVRRGLIYRWPTHPCHRSRPVSIRIQGGRRDRPRLPFHIHVLRCRARAWSRIQSLRLRVGEASWVGPRKILRGKLGSHSGTSRVRLVVPVWRSLRISILHRADRGRRHPLHLRTRHIGGHCVSTILYKLGCLRSHGLRATGRWCTAENLGERSVALKG